MPILGALCGAIQACFALHALKTGRPYYWVFIILVFPVAGCVLYYFIEVYPTSRERTRARKAVRSFVRSFYKRKELRERAADVESCGSVANRVALARECMDQRFYADAVALYRSCLSGFHEKDVDLRFALATALSANGEFADAEKVAWALRHEQPKFRAHEIAMLIAQALEGVQRFDAAAVELQLLVETFPGEEARWRYGALLKRMGRAAEAREVFEQMLEKAQQSPAHYREAQKEWLSLARENV
jgi:hypothetical protein